jgi:signal transduction histidine kinase
VTGRLLAGFLGVLAVVIAAIVVPLGVVVTAQQRDDFRSEARAAARAVSAVAEEHLDDHARIEALDTVVARFAANGDAVVVLDASGHVVARGGPAVSPSIESAARAGRPLPAEGDTVPASAVVGDAGRVLGVVILVRDREPLDHRQAVLWATLLSAAAATLVVGALVGWSLSRWIARPLTTLAETAHRIGRGDVAARADVRAGPPEVRELAAAFNEMTDRVASLVEVQRGMTADVSHQLRTPLAALRLRLELLAGELEAPLADEVVAMIEETNRLSRLVSGLLAVARAEATSPAPEPADVASVAAARVEAWQPVAAERGVDLRLDAAPAMAAVTPGHLEQVLDNLLDNAIDAVPAGGRITVRVRATGAGVELTVADTGSGMPAEQRAHALDRFVTDHAGKGGTGLGLAIVSRLVTADRGTAAVRETPGGGLTVEVLLPPAGTSG